MKIDIRINTKALNLTTDKNNYSFWLSIINKQKCLFSRRNGYIGKLMFNHSVCLRLFGFDLFKGKKIKSNKAFNVITENQINIFGS